MSTPAPVDPDLAQDTVDALWGVAVSIGAAAVVIMLVGWLVVHASRRPFPSSIVTSLTILAALALVGYAIGGEARPELAAIAGTAVGALAGATTSLLAGREVPREVSTYDHSDEAPKRPPAGEGPAPEG